MGSQKQKVRSPSEGLELKKNKNKKASHNKEKSNVSPKAADLNHTQTDEKKINKSSGRKKRDREVESKAESDPSNIKFADVANGDNQKRKLSKKRKGNKVIASKSGVEKTDKLANEVEGDLSDHNEGTAETNTGKMRKKRRKDEKRKKVEKEKASENNRDVIDVIKEESANSKDARRKKKKRHALSRIDDKVVEEAEQNDVYEMSSGDEDSLRGMKKWITEYYQSRPGIKVLQDQIDDFITAHESQQEEARKEQEAKAAEGGWTVVQHHKGRKKTTEAESGTAVGSVAEASVKENLAKKKTNQVGIDFYRFQKREAQMNELMTLQSKFEQDKKRIQQMRAARKFRPY